MIQVYRNIEQLLTLESAHKKNGRNLASGDLSIIENGAIAFSESEILWVGASDKIPNEYDKHQIIDLSGHTLSPGLTDSHTHLIFGGDRSREYGMRLSGATYEEIGKSGGGILSTMKATNSLTDEELFNLSSKRIDKLYNQGIRTLEIKSGYGLDYEEEKRLTLIIDKLKKKYESKITLFNTFMAAHAVPKDFNSSNDYLEKVVIPLLKELAPLNIIDAVDIFHEQGYFNADDVKKLFDVCDALSLNKKIHADEFQDNNGALLATQYNCLSCDHLLRTGEEGIKALSQSDTVATLLPGTGYFLGKEQANARKFIDSGAKLAIASDYNPGSCHWDNLLQIALLSAPNYNLTPEELWCAITLNSSHALGFKDRGAIIKGLKPIFTIFECNSINEVLYNWGKDFSKDSVV